MGNSEDEGRAIMWGAKTLIALVPICLAGVTGIWYVAMQFSEIRTQFARYDARFAQIEERALDRYTLTAASENAMREAIANPGHRVPDPRQPGNYIVVDRAKVE